METGILSKNGKSGRRNHYTFAMIRIFVLCLLSGMPLLPKAQGNKTAISCGFGAAIYQSGYGMGSSFYNEIGVARPINDFLKAGAGFRLGTNPTRPEGFVRMSVEQKFGQWRPSVGLETGITNRASFGDSDGLLAESRRAMLHHVGHTFLSSHIEILSFERKSGWRFSFLEIEFGTHYKNFGRTLRFQSTLIRIGKTF